MNEPAVIEQTELILAEPPASPGTEIQQVKFGSQSFEIDLTNPQLTFAEKGGDPILEKIRTRLAELKPEIDLTTPKGRTSVNSACRSIGSLAKQINESKLKFTERLRVAKAQVDSEGKRIADSIEQMKKEFRRPLTELEEEEAEEEEGHRSALAAVVALRVAICTKAADAAERLDQLGQFTAREWKQFKLKATKEIETTRLFLQSVEESCRKVEAERIAEEQRKLADQLKAKAEREARIKREAADKARKEAEAEADRKMVAIEVEAHREREKAERALQERIAAEIIAKQQADLAEKRAKDAEAAKIAAEERHAREKEEARVAEHKHQLLRVFACGSVTDSERRIPSQLQTRLAMLNQLERRDWQEFSEEASTKIAEAISLVNRIVDEAAERQRKSDQEFREQQNAAILKAERDRVEAGRQAELKAAADRAADEGRCAKIRQRAIDELIKLFQCIPADAVPTADALADMVVDAISADMVPNVRIVY